MRGLEGLEKTEGFPDGISSLSLSCSPSPYFPPFFAPINHPDFSLTNSFPAGGEKTVTIFLLSGISLFLSLPPPVSSPVWPVPLSRTDTPQTHSLWRRRRRGGQITERFTSSPQDRATGIYITPVRQGLCYDLIALDLKCNL